MKKNQIGLIVDASYLYAAKEILGGNIDYAKLRSMVEDTNQQNTDFAICHLKAIPGQRKFLGALKRSGYRYIAEDIDNQSPRWISNVANTILATAPFVSHLVVAVGDSRLAPILEFAMDTWGCKITVIGFASKTSDDIMDLANDGKFIELTSDIVYSGYVAAAAESDSE